MRHYLVRDDITILSMLIKRLLTPRYFLVDELRGAPVRPAPLSNVGPL